MKKIITSVCFLFFFFLMLRFPEQVKSGATEGLRLWYSSIVPILFPFLILSGHILSLGTLPSIIDALFSKNNKKYFFNGWLLYPICFGLFCGFPMGAKTIHDLMAEGKLNKTEATLLLPLANQASPMFLTGYISSYLLKNEVPIEKIMFCFYVPPIIFFLITYIIYRKTVTFKTYKMSPRSRASSDFGSSLTQKNSMSHDSEHTILNSFHVIVHIGVYMMLFTILVELCHVLLPKSNLLSLFLCTIEFTTGLNRLNQMDFLTILNKRALVLSLTSFGGFCTAAQTFALIKEDEISSSSYLFGKSLIAVGVYILSVKILG